MKFYYITKDGKLDPIYQYLKLVMYPRLSDVKARVTTLNKYSGQTGLYAYKEIEIE